MNIHRLNSLGVLLLLIFFCFNLQAQTTSVSGTVIGEDDGLSLPGVNILVKGTSNGTTTDLDGKYNLSCEKGATLVFSFTGFASQEIVVGVETTIDVTLKTSTEVLGEIVVTGYGQTQNKRLVSTAISTLNPKIIQDRPITRVEQAIQGFAPSVVVIQESGSPGAGQTIRMRGIGTAGNATPLILVNGVQVPDMNFINSNDVQNITILKDAASTAIYGARGGNGVLLIETKQEGTKDGTANVTLNSYYGIQSLANEGDYLNTQEYANYYNQSSLYQIREGESPNGRPRFTDEEIAALPNTTWIREVSDEAAIQDHHLSIEGGSNQTTYYAGLGYFDQGGIIGNSNFQRYSMALNLKSQLSEKIDVNVFTTFSKNNREFIAENSINSRIISSVASLPPIFPARDEDGFPFNNGDQTGVVVNGVIMNPQPEFGNPLIALDFVENRSSMDVFYANTLFNWRVLDRLKVSTSFGYLDRKSNSETFVPRFSIPAANIENLVNSLSQSTYDDRFWQWEGYVNIDAKHSENSSLDFILGTSVLSNENFATSRRGENFFANTFDEVNFSNLISEEDKTLFGDQAAKNTTLSYYGRVNYILNEKYLLTGTVRADASSKFGSNNRWGVFPSFSMGWIISSENFLKNSPVFDLLKLRASWGVNGNDQIAPYQYASRFANSQGNLSRLDANPDVKWEEITQTNIGLDANLFKNRIGITLDYYVKETSDMLLNFPIPGFLGIPPPIRNAASVRNKGVELEILYRNRANSDFSYELGFNIGRSTNEVTDLAGGEPIPSANLRSFANSPNISLTDEGHPIASFYGFVFDGVDDKGNATYQDLNGDGVISPSDDRTFIGNPFPDFVYGLNVNLNYKNFDLGASVSGTYGNDLVNSSILYSVIYGNRTTKQVENAWTHENTNSNILRPSATEVVNNEFSDYYIEDGSYLRLKNISLGYTLPEQIFSKVGIEKFRLFVSASNLFTLTDYSGLDPEIGANNDPLNIGIDQGFYPQARTILGGINVNF